MHVGKIVHSEAAQESFDALARAAAVRLNRCGSQCTHTFLVKQPKEQPFRRQGGIKQFVVFHCRSQNAGSLPVIIVLTS